MLRQGEVLLCRGQHTQKCAQMHLVSDAASAEALAAEQQDAGVDQMELNRRKLQLLPP